MKIEVVPTGHIQVRTGEGVRYVLSPGVDVSGEPEEVRAAALEAWTPEVIADYQALLATHRQDGPAEVMEMFRLAIQAHVDAAAQARRYDGGVSLASYVASSNPAWAAEAQAFVSWRDAVWTYAYAELDKVLTGQREQPGVDAFLAELPAIVWP